MLGKYNSNQGFIKEFFGREFFHSAIIQWSLIGSILLNVANWVAMLYFIRPVDFPIVLHYNVYFGVDIIGSWWQAYFLPLIGAGISLVNLILGFVFYSQRERMVAHLLLLASFVIQLCVSIAVASVILINY